MRASVCDGTSLTRPQAPVGTVQPTAGSSCCCTEAAVFFSLFSLCFTHCSTLVALFIRRDTPQRPDRHDSFATPRTVSAATVLRQHQPQRLHASGATEIATGYGILPHILSFSATTRGTHTLRCDPHT